MSLLDSQCRAMSASGADAEQAADASGSATLSSEGGGRPKRRNAGRRTAQASSSESSEEDEALFESRHLRTRGSKRSKAMASSEEDAPSHSGEVVYARPDSCSLVRRPSVRATVVRPNGFER